MAVTYPALSLALGRIEKTLAGVSAVVLGLMAAHIVADVSVRYIVGRPLDGTTEIVSRYYMVAVIFLPVSLLQSQGGHINADLFGGLLPSGVRRALDALSNVLMAVFAFLVAWRCGMEAARATEYSETLQTAYYFLPTWPARWIIPVAAGLLCVRSLLLLAAPQGYSEARHLEV